ncbi:hypothetical protein ABGT15_14590 [Flavobacterium enshiense]|uniref:hypothetical protein n=1 Tax=Flavobacterium enshiense TaxID=1341165 RepID=UPI00345D06A8
MKLITLLTLTVVTLTGCNCQKTAAEKSNATAENTTSAEAGSKQQNGMPVIEYEAVSRGFFLTVKVENKQLYISRNRDAQKADAVPVNDADWKELETLAKSVNLKTVKDLKWPTEKRYYDGAPHANITFVSGGEKYPANGFDHGYPPVEIEKLVNKIVALAEKTQ